MTLKPGVLFLFSCLALALVAAMLRFEAFSQTPFANGWDSYFYLVQLKSLEATGHMHSPEASLIYPYLRVFYWLTGDFVLGMKVGVAVLCGIWVAVVYWYCAIAVPGQLPENGAQKITRLVAAWPGAALAFFSPQLSYFAAQYPKNLLGLIFLGLFIGSLQHPKSNKMPGLWPALLLLLNYFGHRLCFGLAVLYLFFYLFSAWKYGRITAAWLKKHWYYAALAVLLFVVAGQLFPGLAHLADSGRLKGLFRLTPQFAPWSFVQSFGIARISLFWLLEVIGVTVLFAGLLFQALRKRDTARLPLLLLCLSLLFPFMEWSYTSLSWRCWMVFILLVPLGLRDIGFPGGRWSSVLLSLTLCVAAFFSWKSYQPTLQDPDYARFQAITVRTQQYFSKHAAPELLIAHNALAEYFTFTTGTDAMPWLPEYPMDSSRLWRIAAGVHLPALQYFSGKEQANIHNLGGHYALLPEYVWQQALMRATAEQDSDFIKIAHSWLNPSRMRPGWLLRRKE